MNTNKDFLHREHGFEEVQASEAKVTAPKSTENAKKQSRLGSALEGLRNFAQRVMGFKIKSVTHSRPGTTVKAIYSDVTHSFTVFIRQATKGVGSGIASAPGNKNIFFESKSTAAAIIAASKEIAQIGSFVKASSATETVKSTTNSKQEHCLEKKWEDGLGHHAIERCARVNTLQTALDISEGQLKLLQKHPEKNKITIEEELKYQQKLIRQAESGKTWATSNNYRDLFRGEIKLLNKANSQNPLEAIKNSIPFGHDCPAKKYLSKETFQEIVDEKYVALSKNMRIHSVVSDQLPKESSAISNYVMRCGVVSDMSNGYTNLEQLNRISTDLLSDDPSKRLTGLRELHVLRQEIRSIEQNELKAGKNHIEAASQYAFDQLGGEYGALDQHLKEAIERKNALSKAELDAITASLKRTQSSRMKILEREFLQMVIKHIENGGLPPKGEALKMLDVRLLNHNSKSVDPTGWYHNEENEMLDMAAIFRNFNAKKIIIGEDGPGIDENGNIRLPGGKAGSEFEFELKTLLINQSVQGYTKNDSSTRALGEEALTRLHEFFEKDDLPAMREMLTAEETSTTNAVDILEMARKGHCRLSVGCLSAKDRTGQVCAGWSCMKRMSDIFSSDFKTLMMRLQQTGDSIAGQVIKENTPPLDKMKLTSFKQDWGVGTGIAGWLIRAPIYLQQAAGILTQRAEIANELGYSFLQKSIYVLKGDSPVNLPPKEQSKE